MWSTLDHRRLALPLLLVLLGKTACTQAADPSFTINTGIDFGRIVSMANSSCALNAASGSLNGDACLDTVGIPGDVEVQADANQSYSITLFPPSGVTNQISFQPLLSNGSNSDNVTAGADGRINFKVGGVLTTGGIVPTGSATSQFSYTIRVDSN